MTNYWWGEKGWGRRTVDLACHLKDGPIRYANSEFVLQDLASPAQHGAARGYTHDLTLVPPAEFLCRVQSALGDCIVETPTYISWYQPEPETAGKSIYARWLHNFGNANYGSRIIVPGRKNNKRIALTSFTQRSRMLAQFTDWPYEDAEAMMKRIVAKSLIYPTKSEILEDWEGGLEEDRAFVAEGLWRPFLTNPYLPVGEAEPIYRKLVEAHLRQLEKPQGQGRVYIVTDAVGFLSQNPNTPSEYLVRAGEAAERIIKADGASQREALQHYLSSIRKHPNYPDGETPIRRKASNFEDSVLFRLFEEPYNPASTDLSGAAAELLSNPARETVLRQIISHLFVAEEATKIALLLPAAGAILEEFSEVLGEDSEEVPLEWLMTAMS